MREPPFLPADRDTGGIELTEGLHLHFFQYAPGVTDDPGEVRLTEIQAVFADNGKMDDKNDLKAAANAGSLLVAQLQSSAEVVGALTLREWSSTDTYRLNKYLSTSEKVSSDPPALHLLDLVTVPTWQRQGVATELVKAAMRLHRYDQSMLYGRAFASSRVPRDGSGPTSRGLLEKLGFIELITISDYYRHLGPEELHCIHCDPLWDGLPCNCLGVQMRWTRPPLLVERSMEENIDSAHIPPLA